MKLIDKNHLQELMEKHSQMDYPDVKISHEIMDILGLLNIPDLGFTLNSKMKEERDAALNMVKRHLEGLLSDDLEKYEDAKETLSQFYYRVDEPSILES